MMVIGTDPHKAEHTCAAVDAATGELRSSETVGASGAGHQAALAWGRALDCERVWAIEDCRHVSGRLERFFVARGERAKRLDRLALRLARCEQTARVRICREQVTRLRQLARRCRELEAEIGVLVAAYSPALLELKGCGALSAAKIVAETAGVKRFATDARFARHAGIAPIPASSGQNQRQRLHRGGNRQLNCAVHRIAVTQGRIHPPAIDYLARKQAEGKSRIEALRCLKRHLARTIWRTMTTNANAPAPTLALT